jgi:4-methylaminobutanoate oxidase (formaldehyde-forming)
MCGVSVPLASAEHFYVYSKPFDPVVPSMLPVLRDPDAYIYYREWSGGLLMGGFEPNAKPAFQKAVPDDFEFALLPEDWDHFDILMQGALHRTPCLETAQVKMINGPESFTPDNQYILGEAPFLKGFYVAAGFNSSGIASSGGAGKALAEWIVNKAPTMDLWNVDIRRFGDCHDNSAFLSSRVAETLGLHYQITWPRRELQSARNIRRSPLYGCHKDLGAVFGSKFGWERVNYYVGRDGKVGALSYGRQSWFDQVGVEHKACREGVALFDVTSFSKLMIEGPHATNILQRLCVNNVDVEVGKLVYTSMCNHRGGMESDVTVSRLSKNKFLVITATAQCTRDTQWILSHIMKDEFATVTDVTSSYAMLALMGPHSRQLLSSISSCDLSKEKFQFGTSQKIDVGMVNVTAHRITYVGELGYELLIPTESALTVYETLQQAAHNLAIPLTNAGYYAIEGLRLEKGYRAWGHDVTPNITPLEAGLAFTIDFKKEFIGRSALETQKREGIRQRIVSVKFDDSKAYAYGGEPIYRNGVLSGYLTSAAYGYTVGSMVGLGILRGLSTPPNSSDSRKYDIVTPSYINSGNYEVQLNGEMFKVYVSLKCPYDPKGVVIGM